MDTERSLKNQFLIAMPSMTDPTFFHSVTYICEHNEEGAMGLIINHASELNLGDVFDQMSIMCNDMDIKLQPVLVGGPVQQEQGFLIHRPLGTWVASMSVNSEIAITTSRDILEAIAKGEGPSNKLITLGYAGWQGGQLEQEIQDNYWIHGPAEPSILFDAPVLDRWRAAASSLGVDMNLLSGDIGHA